jgi:holliday junction DNA helicase RuvB
MEDDMDSITSTRSNANATNSDRALRPKTLDDFIGQSETVANLRVFIQAALQRGDALDHQLYAGPPGTGKTTLAQIIANEMGSKLVTVNAPALKTKGELASLLASLKKGDILFLDEIHSLNPKIEEVLYPAMEDYRLVVVAGNNPLNIALEPFTLIGATTLAGKLQRPLRDRFGVIVEMQLYSEDELSGIVHKSASKLGLSCDDVGARELARRSRGTPRIANRLLRRIRDFAQYLGTSHLDAAIVQETCHRLGIDTLGLDRTSQRYLQILAEKGKPQGLNSLVSLLNEPKDTIEEVIEPHLMRLGLMEKTHKGRAITHKGYYHLYPQAGN